MNGCVGTAEAGEKFDQRLGGFHGEMVLGLGDGQRSCGPSVRETGSSFVVGLLDVCVVLFWANGILFKYILN